MSRPNYSRISCNSDETERKLSSDEKQEYQGINTAKSTDEGETRDSALTLQRQMTISCEDPVIYTSTLSTMVSSKDSLTVVRSSSSSASNQVVMIVTSCRCEGAQLGDFSDEHHDNNKGETMVPQDDSNIHNANTPIPSKLEATTFSCEEIEVNDSRKESGSLEQKDFPEERKMSDRTNPKMSTFETKATPCDREPSPLIDTSLPIDRKPCRENVLIPTGDKENAQFQEIQNEITKAQACHNLHPRPPGIPEADILKDTMLTKEITPQVYDPQGMVYSEKVAQEHFGNPSEIDIQNVEEHNASYSLKDINQPTVMEISRSPSKSQVKRVELPDVKTLGDTFVQQEDCSKIDVDHPPEEKENKDIKHVDHTSVDKEKEDIRHVDHTSVDKEKKDFRVCRETGGGDIEESTPGVSNFVAQCSNVDPSDVVECNYLDQGEIIKSKGQTVKQSDQESEMPVDPVSEDDALYPLKLQENSDTFNVNQTNKQKNKISEIQGFENDDALLTCWMNTVLCAMCYIPVFAENLKAHMDRVCHNNACLSCILGRLTQSIQTKDQPDGVSTEELQVYLDENVPQFAPGEPHCPIEFIEYCLQKIHGENVIGDEETSFITNELELRVTLQCRQEDCDTESTSKFKMVKLHVRKKLENFDEMILHMSGLPDKCKNSHPCGLEITDIRKPNCIVISLWPWDIKGHEEDIVGAVLKSNRGTGYILKYIAFYTKTSDIAHVKCSILFDTGWKGFDNKHVIDGLRYHAEKHTPIILIGLASRETSEILSTEYTDTKTENGKTVCQPVN